MELRVSLSGERPDEPALRQFEAVGLLRGEFVFRNCERYVTDQGARADLAAYVSLVCATFAGKAVWYRLADFWSDEANVLAGNPHPIEETNPIVGVRGVRRILAFPEEASLEIAAMACVRSAHDNLHLLLPFVQDGDEMAQAVALCRGAGWRGRIGSMIEIPAAVFCAADIVRAGATNLLVGINDLTSLMLARERGPPEMKLHKAIWEAIAMVGRAVDGVEWGVGGSLSPAILSRAMDAGVPYATLHYAELPDLLGSACANLEDVSFVAQVKQKTREAKRRRANPVSVADRG